MNDVTESKFIISYKNYTKMSTGIGLCIVFVSFVLTSYFIYNASYELNQIKDETQRVEQELRKKRAELSSTLEAFSSVQSTLNNTQETLRKTNNDDSGASALKNGVDTALAALKNVSRNLAPLDWAQAQNNLGHRACVARLARERAGAFGRRHC